LEDACWRFAGEVHRDVAQGENVSVDAFRFRAAAVDAGSPASERRPRFVSEDDEDLAELIRKAHLDKEQGGLYLEPGFELSFRTSPRWRQRAITVQRENVALTIPHPIDILIAKLNRLEPKDLRAFERVIQLTGHPTPAELMSELQNAVDLFRPAFDEDSPNRFPDNVQKLWREVFRQEIDVRREIIEPALGRRRIGYGEAPGADYKRELGN
jgi:hypothetical protein